MFFWWGVILGFFLFSVFWLFSAYSNHFVGIEKINYIIPAFTYINFLMMFCRLCLRNTSDHIMC